MNSISKIDKNFWKSGHQPTLWASFLYFDFCFAIWVLNGAMAPFISESFGLSPTQKGLMVSVPILAGALMRFPLGVLAQYITRKGAALVEMSLILLGLLYGYFFVNTFSDVLNMGVILGIAGASFGVALSLGSGWFPKEYKGLAMGIAGAGNSGTVLAMLFAPPLAQSIGWKNVYGVGALFMLIPILVMIIFAKEPPDVHKQSFKEHIKCLFEKDGWIFNLIYIITFGGFIGLSSFLPTYFYDQYHVSKIEAGQLTMLAAIMGSGARVFGGWLSDRWGGINSLFLMISIVIVSMFVASFEYSLVLTTITFMIAFAALGAGNGSLFQLVPLRWPVTTAVAGSMIGEIGALGGSFLPNAMGISKQYYGTFQYGFYAFILLALIVLTVLYFAQKEWTKKWVGKGGRVLPQSKKELRVDYEDIIKINETQTKVNNNNLIQYNTIMCPVNGKSDLIDKTRHHLVYFSKICNSKIILVYVEENASKLGMLAPDSKEWNEIKNEWIHEGYKILNNEKKRLMEMGVNNIELVMRVGEVADEIIKVSEEYHVDLIVLPSQKKSPLGQLLMGAPTYNLFKKTTVPIMRIVR